MRQAIRTLAYALVLTQQMALAFPGPRTGVARDILAGPITRRQLSAPTVESELGAILSDGSLIFGPEDPSWEEAMARWNLNAVQTIEVVVQPASENDMPKIVKYCNENSIEFLMYGAGKGLTTTLNRFRGLEINTTLLRAITVHPSGKSARIQAGARMDEIINTLWERGYETATGSNGCVGIVGAGLGGGYGRLQGAHGLVSDNFINLNVVLASGKALQASKSSNSDLFWAMKGAGHNFAVVTSLDMKIYNKGSCLWHYHNYVWSTDKLETVFQKLNEFHNNGTAPVKMAVNFGQISVDPTYSETEGSLSDETVPIHKQSE